MYSMWGRMITDEHTIKKNLIFDHCIVFESQLRAAAITAAEASRKSGSFFPG